MPDEKTVIQLENVGKTYESPTGNVEILRDISLSVRAGDSVAVTGPSGSGKSTLLNITGALDKPTTGRVLLGGRDLTGLGEQELAAVRNREIGFVFQMHNLLPQCTVLENVMIPTLPLRSVGADVHDRAVHLLESVGLGARMSYRPGRLSGGECQRVAVVRALINKPALLLADEPTGSLDQASADQLARLFTELNRNEGVTLVVVTHSRELAQRMKRSYTLRNGELKGG